MKDFITSHLAAILASGWALSLLVALGKKYLPALVHKTLGLRLAGFLSPKDPDDMALVKAMCVWAQKKYPSSGLGPARYRLVAAKLAGQPALAQMVEAVLDAVDVEVMGQVRDIAAAPPPIEPDGSLPSKP